MRLGWPEMVKRKPRTQISVADGAGGMMPVEDRRFERGRLANQFRHSYRARTIGAVVTLFKLGMQPARMVAIAVKPSGPRGEQWNNRNHCKRQT